MYELSTEDRQYLFNHGLNVKNYICYRLTKFLDSRRPSLVFSAKDLEFSISTDKNGKLCTFFKLSIVPLVRSKREILVKSDLCSVLLSRSTLEEGTDLFLKLDRKIKRTLQQLHDEVQRRVGHPTHLWLFNSDRYKFLEVSVYHNCTPDEATDYNVSTDYIERTVEINKLYFVCFKVYFKLDEKQYKEAPFKKSQEEIKAEDFLYNFLVKNIF
nr:MAG TPA: hypothetical protein [Caudoviricetes sp.]